jgi:hypothetical protein
LFTGYAHQPAHRLDHEIIGGGIALRPGLPKAGNGTIHEAWIDLL